MSMLADMELEALLMGSATRRFPPWGDNGFCDHLTVRRVSPDTLEYLWIDGPVDRDTAAGILNCSLLRTVNHVD